MCFTNNARKRPLLFYGMRLEKPTLRSLAPLKNPPWTLAGWKDWNIGLSKPGTYPDNCMRCNNTTQHLTKTSRDKQSQQHRCVTKLQHCTAKPTYINNEEGTRRVKVARRATCRGAQYPGHGQLPQIDNCHQWCI